MMLFVSIYGCKKEVDSDLWYYEVNKFTDIYLKKDSSFVYRQSFPEATYHVCLNIDECFDFIVKTEKDSIFDYGGIYFARYKVICIREYNN
jgi:hypothetical protein